jgi:hypothetical protein
MKTCFVIAPIGDESSDTRKRSDQVLNHIIAPTVRDHGYQAVRADQIAEPGMITSHVIQHIVEDALVTADLTDWNPNVFYELAIRHVIRKPLIQMIRKGDKIPFDIAGMRTVQFDIHDLDSVAEARREISNQIENLEHQTKEIETPISVALNLQALKASDRPEDRSLAELLALGAELRAGFLDLQKKLASPESVLPADYLKSVLQSFDLSNRLTPGVLRDLDRSASELLEEFPQLKDCKSFERIRRSVYSLQAGVRYPYGLEH